MCVCVCERACVCMSMDCRPSIAIRLNLWEKEGGEERKGKRYAPQSPLAIPSLSLMWSIIIPRHVLAEAPQVLPVLPLMLCSGIVNMLLFIQRVV